MPRPLIQDLDSAYHRLRCGLLGHTVRGPRGVDYYDGIVADGADEMRDVLARVEAEINDPEKQGG